MISAILTNTPFYVWVILIILFKRGSKATKEHEISLIKMLIVPVIFTLWGLDELLTEFSHIDLSLISYAIFVVIGTGLAYNLYSKHRKVYQKDNALFVSGTYIPLIIMMVNFIVKYDLNVAMNIDTSLFTSLQFNILYSVLCGFSVGLFFGGLLQILKNPTKKVEI